MNSNASDDINFDERSRSTMVSRTPKGNRIRDIDLKKEQAEAGDTC
jgi:hypothetical protein